MSSFMKCGRITIYIYLTVFTDFTVRITVKVMFSETFFLRLGDIFLLAFV